MTSNASLDNLLSVLSQPLAIERPRMPHHGQHRHRHVPFGWRRCADADQECRHGDVPRQGRRQERLPFLHQGDQDPVDRASDAGNGPASRAGSRSVRAALSAEGGYGDRTDNRRRGAVALDASRTRRAAAHAIHTARRGNRVDRPDRPLGTEGSLRAKHGLAAPRIAADIDGGQSLAEAVRRSSTCCRISTRRWRRAACLRCCCSSRSPKAW